MPNTREKLIGLLKNLPQVNHFEAQVQGLDYVFGCAADHLISNGVTVQEWISASEPPKEIGCYLISVKHWLDGKPVTREAFWNGADWLSCYWEKGDRVELTPRVTHWQYLPQPPKGE